MQVRMATIQMEVAPFWPRRTRPAMYHVFDGAGRSQSVAEKVPQQARLGCLGADPKASHRRTWQLRCAERALHNSTGQLCLHGLRRSA